MSETKTKYRPRLLLDAVQWFPEMGEIPGVRRFQHNAECVTYGDPTGQRYSVAAGDWIVTHPSGLFSKFKPEEFEATYEPVSG